MARRPMPSPSVAAKNWQQNLTNATTKITQGVQAVQVAPTALAAQAADKYAAGVQQAVATGKYQNGLMGVSLQSWQQSMINKGVPRIASGASAALDKTTKAFTSLYAHIQSGLAQLESMPRGGLDNNLARGNAFARYMATYKKQ